MKLTGAGKTVADASQPLSPFLLGGFFFRTALGAAADRARLILFAAQASSAMTHIAVQEALDGKIVECMEPVTNSQYGAARGGGR
jgi:hypothetical protein